LSQCRIELYPELCYIILVIGERVTQGNTTEPSPCVVTTACGGASPQGEAFKTQGDGSTVFLGVLFNNIFRR